MTAWDKATIGTVCSTYSGGTPSTAHPEYYGGDIPWIASADLNQGRISSVKGRITRLGLDRSSAKLVKPGTPLIALYGATAGVPAMTYVGGAINQAVLAMIPRGIDAEYLFQWLQANRDEIIDRYTQGGQPNLSGAIVRSIEVPLPPAAEQRRIASTLRDADDLIAALEQMIVKKLAIRKGMMQQLLAGETRLPGFQGEWVVIKLGDVAQFSLGSGLSKADISSQGALPCIHYGELFTHYRAEVDTVSSRTDRIDLRVRSVAMDVLMPTADVTPRGLAKASAVLISGVVLGGGILVIRPNPVRIYAPFLAHVVRQDANQVLSLVRGSTVFHLYAADMHNFSLRVPEVAEQQAICTVLRDAQAELDRLDKRLAKAKALKFGMAQELLTGRTRLPVEGRAA